MAVSAIAVVAGHTRQPRRLCLPCARGICAVALGAVPYILREDYFPAKVRIALVDLLRMVEICTAMKSVYPPDGGHRPVAAPAAQGCPSLISETIA